jgi:energy-coupling factor transporter ATP-binding protein EcfA2
VIELSGRPLRNTDRDRRLFVDRTETIELVAQVVLNSGNVLLVGPRGAGKSSLLRRIAHVLEKRGEPHTSVVDGRAADSTLDFLALVRDALNAWETVPLGRAAGALASAAGAFIDSPQLIARPSPSDTQALLTQLRALGRALPEEQHRIVLVDEMPSPQTAHTLFGRLRDELWELPIVWVVAADERDDGSYREPPADAFWQRTVAIPSLSADDARDLLLRRLDDTQMSPTVLDQLVETAAGNPRRLITLAHQVVLEGSDIASLLERDASVKREVALLSEPAKRLLSELEANGPASPSDQGLLSRLGWTRGRASQVFQELESRGLVTTFERAGTGGRPRRVYEATR